MPNVVAAPWSGPYGGVPPWDRATPELFPEAFAAALEEQRREIDAIAGNPAPPSFDNTIAALELSGETLDRALRLFGVLRQNIGSPEALAIDREWQPKL